jgi:GT2 family glycosyltransferase
VIQAQEAVVEDRTSALVSVIIVNWNAGALLERCVASLSAQTVLPHEIIVFDNASTDGSVNPIIDKFPSVRVIVSERNLGFAAANNLAIQKASSRTEWLAFLNPDAFPMRGWLSALLKAAAAKPEYACFGSRMMDARATAIVDGIGDVYHASGIAWRAGHGMRLNSWDTRAREIFSPCAAAALYRRSIFLEVGGFDEDFFCYVEDVDVGFRLRLVGHKAMYVPDAVVHHVGSATTGGKRSEFAMYHGHRNLVWTFVKDMPGILFWVLLPLHILMNLASVLWFSLQGRGGVILRAKRDALRELPKMWGKRRAIQATRLVSAREIWQVMDKQIVPARLRDSR